MQNCTFSMDVMKFDCFNCISSRSALCLSQFQLGASPRQPPGISSKNLPGGWDLTLKSCPGAGNSARAGILLKGILPRLSVNLLVLLSHIPYKNVRNFSWPVYLKFSLGYGYPHPNDYDYVRRFVRVLVLLVINTGCLKKLLKNVDFQFKLC